MTPSPIPIVVDLDGTLIRTDLLLESVIKLLKVNPLLIFMLPVWLLAGKARLKSEIARRVDLDVTGLPYNEDVMAWLEEAKTAGHELALATASHGKYADRVAEHLEIFDRVFATNDTENLKSKAKAARLVETYGEKGFVYAGNESADLDIWERASEAVVVGGSTSLVRDAERRSTVTKTFDVPGPSLRIWIKALRLHQWMKNLLIFVPLVTAHRLFEPDVLIEAVLAFLTFSLCASSVYLLNDLLDLEADRHHKSKRRRPFAAGTLPIAQGLALIPILLVIVIAIALILPPMFALVLATYYVATTAYSFSLKKKVMLDVIILAGLFTTRIIAGAAVTGIPLSEWLLLFSMFVFLSLAIVKRYTELVDLRSRGFVSEARGRGYAVEDIELLAALGGASGYISILVFALYLNTETVQRMYGNPIFLWAACPLLLYWISRVWILAHRGQMDDDPIVFAIKDPISRYVGIAVGAIFLLALL